MTMRPLLYPPSDGVHEELRYHRLLAEAKGRQGIFMTRGKESRLLTNTDYSDMPRDCLQAPISGYVGEYAMSGYPWKSELDNPSRDNGTIDEILDDVARHFGKTEVVRHFGKTEVVRHFGKTEVVRHFGKNDTTF